MNANHLQISKSRVYPSGVLALAVLAAFLFAGCANFANYGKYKHSREVSRMFEKLNLPPDYTYYYAHTFSQPEALIGIEPGYTLDNHLWHRANPGELRRLTDNMYVRSGYSPLIFGSYITAPDGRTIGIYYSSFQGGPIVMEADNKVNVDLPNKQIRPPALPSFG